MKRKIQAYIRGWESRGYPNGIPDEAPENLEARNRVPSYRLICLAIMKNDMALVTLGFGRKPCEIYNVLKRIELRARGVSIKEPARQIGLTL